jgi:hypothetical protein
MNMTYRTVWAFQYRGTPLDLGTVITPETEVDHHEVQLGWNIGSVAPVDPDAPVDPPPIDPPPVDGQPEQPIEPPPADEQPGHPVQPMTSHDAPVRAPVRPPPGRPAGRR